MNNVSKFYSLNWSQRFHFNDIKSAELSVSALVVFEQLL